jgi:hypothetical protein
MSLINSCSVATVLLHSIPIPFNGDCAFNFNALYPFGCVNQFTRSFVFSVMLPVPVAPGAVTINRFSSSLLTAAVKSSKPKNLRRHGEMVVTLKAFCVAGSLFRTNVKTVFNAGAPAA